MQKQIFRFNTQFQYIRSNKMQDFKMLHMDHWKCALSTRNNL